MIKELNANLFVVLPQREQVIEVVERYDGYPLGKRKMDIGYVTYKSYDLAPHKRSVLTGRMVPERPLEKLSKQEIINELLEHIYGDNARRVRYIVINAA